jgi:anti-anti-sigma regulatory factor
VVGHRGVRDPFTDPTGDSMGVSARDRLLAGGIPTGGVAAHDAKSHTCPVVARVSGAVPGLLDVSIRRRGNVIELRLAGALDAASAPRLGEAMALARAMATTARAAHPAAARDGRRGHAATIVIDTSDIVDVDASGYRSLEEALVRPNGLWDRGVDWIVGPAVAAFETSLRAASTPS